MYALTIWQPWASLIVLGFKTVEWRGYSYLARNWRLKDQRIVIHAGKTDPRQHLRDLLASEARLRGSLGPRADIAGARAAIERWAGNPSLLPRGAGLGTAILREPKRADRLLGIPPSDELNIGWPLDLIERFDEPVPCNGSQGFWRWPLPLPRVKGSTP